MYYFIIVNKYKQTCRVLTTLFILSVSLFAYQLSLSAEDLFKGSAEEYRSKGYEAQQDNNFEDALTNYAKAISLGLNTASVYNDIGVIYEQLGVDSKAEESYLKAIEIDSNYLPPYTNLAYLYQVRGDIKKAIFYFQERFKRAKDDDPWKERVQVELYRIDPKLQKQITQFEAEKLNEQVVQKAHEEFYLTVIRSEKHFQNGQQFLEQKDYNSSLAEFDRALAITPKNPKILKMRDWVLYKKNVENIKEKIAVAMEALNSENPESAKKEFQEILTIIPDKAIQKPE